MAAHMAESNELKALISDKNHTLDDLPGLFNDLRLRLEGSFNFTKEQKVSHAIESYCVPSSCQNIS